MGFVKCEDIASMVIEDVTDSLPSGYRLLDLNYEVFKLICGQFDKMKEELEIQTFSVEVNRDDLSIKVSMVCPMLTVDDAGHSICELIQRSLSFLVKPLGDGEYMTAEFHYPGVWAKV